MRRLALAFSLLVVSTIIAPAQQTVTVVGQIIPGDCAAFLATTVLKDGGTPCASLPLVLQNGTTATTQTSTDNTTKVATDQFVQSVVTTAVAANPRPTTRQAILSGSVDSNGSPNFAAAGTGLNVNLSATATPLTLDFAAGYNTSGAIDFIGQLSADVTSYWASLPANQVSFLSIDRNTSTGALTATQTLIRPQRGRAFYNARQSLVHFDTSLPPPDDWGNTWQTSGATLTAGCAKFGSTGLRLSGTSSYAKTGSIQNPGQGAWTIDVWNNLDSNVNAQVFSVGTAFGVFVGTNGSGKPALFLSSTGLSWDISNGNAGSTTVTASAFHHWALVFTGSESANPNYTLYLDDVAQVGISSSAIIWPDGATMTVGSQSGSAGSTAGCWDEFDFVPYARWVAAGFSLPVAAYTVAGDWFDTGQMVWKTASGPGPTWSVIQRLGVAEAVTNGSAVSAIYDYSAATQYNGSDFAYTPSNGNVLSGNNVFFSSAPQFYTNNNLAAPDTLNAVRTLVVAPGPNGVPPDAKYFAVQAGFHAPIQNGNGTTGPPNQDCLLLTRIPTGTGQTYGALGTHLSNYTGMGTATQSTAFTESGADAVLWFPVIHGVAALEAVVSGTTCSPNGGSNDARLMSMSLLGFVMP